jgi:hypothetical protein
MARGGDRILDADTRIIQPVKLVAAHLAAAERARLAVQGPLVERARAQAGCRATGSESGQ